MCQDMKWLRACLCLREGSQCMQSSSPGQPLWRHVIIPGRLSATALRCSPPRMLLLWCVDLALHQPGFNACTTVQ